MRSRQSFLLATMAKTQSSFDQIQIRRSGPDLLPSRLTLHLRFHPN